MTRHPGGPGSPLTTSKKLWLGFGILSTLLVLVVLTIIVRLRSIETQVGEMTSARKLSAEAGQLEGNILSAAFAPGRGAPRDARTFRAHPDQAGWTTSR
jgi:hypothetical protein